MGAISSLSSIPILEQHLHDANEDVSVRETCEIALAKIQFDHAPSSSSSSSSPSSTVQRSIYDSIDPAPPTLSMHETSSDTHPSATLSIPDLRTNLLDSDRSLFERYRAMFALRNDGSREAVLALADGFEDSSALFRHEIAYIFGQLCSEYSVPSLLKVLRNDKEEDMVRHEAAEALGSIATQDVLPALREYREKGPRVVRESCEVALDMYDVSSALSWMSERD
jgi:deoxyhypusine monooxygenase